MAEVALLQHIFGIPPAGCGIARRRKLVCHKGITSAVGKRGRTGTGRAGR